MVNHYRTVHDHIGITDTVASSVVRAVAEAVHPPGVTRADLDAVVGVLVDAPRVAQVRGDAPSCSVLSAEAPDSRALSLWIHRSTCPAAPIG